MQTLHTVAWPRGVWGQLPPHLCQDGARDFLRIDEKIGVGGSGKSSDKKRALPKNFHLCLPLYTVFSHAILIGLVIKSLKLFVD